MWLKRKVGEKRAPVEQLGALESELMERVWAQSEVSVREVYEQLSDRLAYTTIMTTLDRLYKKGLLNRRPLQRAFYYSAKISKQQYNQQLTEHLLGIAEFESSKQAVLSCFVDYVSESDHKLLDQLDALIKAKKRSLRKRGPQ
ncbi:MAG: BlaI/MecI/CopY family transcriptional regulator [Acidobacteria bacterium]|nr:BlaI/MecI/CopY family transcriptional regulator [Acidobacteriota bacterium]MBV9145470.1 BlaI/MecI/CopY family transcriptional regulator [Acidobacteriota bacterium]MBV9436244.1 BlaI/MecI/CopY family transcriptional regulator [Acidobacteriota bacterium]